MQSMPFFSKWTKNALAKLSYFFEKKCYRTNQVVYKEGDLCTHVFLIYKGEFQVTRNVKSAAEPNFGFNMMEFLP